jgi:hypothetical protein
MACSEMIQRCRQKWLQQVNGMKVYIALLKELTPWNINIVENLIVAQLSKIYSASYGTRRFITALTRARHRCLSGVQYIAAHPIPLRSI